MPIITGALLPHLEALVRTDDSSCTGACLRNWKIGFSALLMAEGILFAYFVVFFRRFLTKGAIDRVSIYAHAASAGLFLATGFMHILPEALQSFSGHGEHNEHSGDSHSGHNHDERTTRLQRGVRALLNLAVHQEDDHDHGGHDHNDGTPGNADGTGNLTGGDKKQSEEEGTEFPWVMFSFLMAFYLLFFIERICVPFIMKRARSKLEKVEEGAALHDGEEHDHDHGVIAPEALGGDDSEGVKPSIFSTAFLVAFIQVAGISLHVVFEGMAMGQGTNFGNVLNIFISVACHRWATAMAIAVLVARRVNHLGFFLLVALFTAVIPLGVGIGAALSDISDKPNGILFGFSAGVFLYIGAVEGIGAAFGGDHKHNRLALFATMVLGSSVIFVVTGILVANNVGHSH